jgi:hypothetical protein
MKLSGAEFLGQDKKAITLMGMSGVGKSHISLQLEEWGWRNYSCDYQIGTKYLKRLIPEGRDRTADDISWLSDFVGQLGNREKGGIALSEFELRQRLYYNAECDCVVDAGPIIDSEEKNIVIDSSGSLCEIEDENVLKELGERTLFVYLKVRQEGHADILERASSYPKPLYFPPAFLEERLARYKDKFDLQDNREIDPAEFLRWIFPHLFEARLPKYQALAEKYGVIVPSHEVDLSSEEAFLKGIAGALDAQQGYSI